MFVGLFSLGLLMLTLRIPSTVTSSDQLGAVHFGLPFWFVEQDQAARVPTTYPIDLPMGPLAAYPTRFSRLRMTGSYLLILFAVAGLVITIRSLRKRFSSS
jgi:hypothetical protein